MYKANNSSNSCSPIYGYKCDTGYVLSGNNCVLDLKCIVSCGSTDASRLVTKLPDNSKIQYSCVKKVGNTCKTYYDFSCDIGIKSGSNCVTMQYLSCGSREYYDSKEGKCLKYDSFSWPRSVVASIPGEIKIKRTGAVKLGTKDVTSSVTLKCSAMMCKTSGKFEYAGLPTKDITTDYVIRTFSDTEYPYARFQDMCQITYNGHTYYSDNRYSGNSGTQMYCFSK